MTAEAPIRVFTDESTAPRAAIFARGTVARQLADGLHRSGVRCAPVAGEATDTNPLSSVEATHAFMSTVCANLGGVDAMILSCADEDVATPQPIATMTEGDWIARCERPLQNGRIFFQAAHDMLRPTGGRIILLIPSLAMTGADGLLPWAAAAEGLRSLAKAAARAWGNHGIRVNSIAVPAARLAGIEAELERPGLPAPSLHAGSDWTSTAQLIATMLTPGFAAVTGTTIGADDGRWMTP
ncbi:NAD(P)-dependent dehydrogenase (short-subunit alcohol dehydrogenase family) [Sphingobium sp. OAS761]|uniref:SDR family oxidoreductase n=1 Tax=Sphingobium sp. OAS761 TaxID=2817901 RepID=UPI0020A0A231|nr:SDR family oxidoreductase [Sphingobium sp. OAS761]MCP1470353.1 NAD(P)-dependent dehydrogenase (short-subunit alcohol dehydrogenase family) [Sphingobium sp. OAS761]